LRCRRVLLPTPTTARRRCRSGLFLKRAYRCLHAPYARTRCTLLPVLRYGTGLRCCLRTTIRRTASHAHHTAAVSLWLLRSPSPLRLSPTHTRNVSHRSSAHYPVYHTVPAYCAAVIAHTIVYTVSALPRTAHCTRYLTGFSKPLRRGDCAVAPRGVPSPDSTWAATARKERAAATAFPSRTSHNILVCWSAVCGFGSNSWCRRFELLGSRHITAHISAWRFHCLAAGSRCCPCTSFCGRHNALRGGLAHPLTAGSFLCDFGFFYLYRCLTPPLPSLSPWCVTLLR